MKVALVTGAAQGIGAAIAEALSKAGYTVVVSGSKDSTDARVNGLKNYIKLDISSSADREQAVEFVKKNFGRLDVLVNNAGVAPKTRVDLLDTSEDSFDYVNNINCKATFFMCQAFARLMCKRKAAGLPDYNPKIINIGSISAYTSSTMRGEYCVSKAGASMVTKLFADRLASEGIGVFEVRPGIIKTPMTAGVEEKYQAMIDNNLTPVKRLGEPEEVAAAVVACMTLPDFCTGTVIDADGGFSIRRL